MIGAMPLVESLVPTEAVTSPVFLGVRLALDLAFGLFLIGGLIRRSAVRGSRPRYTWATIQRAACWPGLVFVVVVPGAYAAVLTTLMDYEAAEELFPFVLVTLAVPIALLVHPLTRRFARYMLLGIFSTALVVGGVAALVLWLLVSRG